MKMKIPVIIVVSAVTATVAFAAPSPPDRIKLTPRNGAMEISWVKSPDDLLTVSGYEVVRGVFPTGPFQSVCTTVKNAVSCMDRNAEPEKPYYYKVRALGFADDGHSPFTTSVRGELPPPEVPVHSTATSGGAHR